MNATKTDYESVKLGALDLTNGGTMLAGQDTPLQRLAKLTVRAQNRGLTLPTGLQALLLNTALPFREVPAAPFTGTNPSAVFSVPAGTYGAQTVSDPAGPYPQQRSALPDAKYAIGVITNINITLPRITQFNVSGPTSATEVTVKMGAAPEAKANGGTTIEVSETTTTTGATATVSAPGFRTRTVTVPNQLVSTVPVTLLPTTVVGTINVANESNGNGVLTAKSGSTTLQGSITSNKYRVEGLVPNTDGTDRIWTIRYVKDGVGEGTTPITVTSTGPVAGVDGTIVGGTITPAPRDVNYLFTVSTPSGSGTTPVAEATVTVFNSTLTSIGTGITGDGNNGTVNGTATVPVKENTGPESWTVSKTGFLTKSGTLSLTTSSPISVLLQPQWEVTGKVFDSAAAVVVGARIDVCPTSPATRCTATGDRTTTTAAGGNYTLRSDLSEGTYTIWASANGKEQSITLTVNAAGVPSTSSSPAWRINLPA